jgi:hypothetical protein
MQQKSKKLKESSAVIHAKCLYNHEINTILENEQCMGIKQTSCEICNGVIKCIDRYWSQFKVKDPIGFKGLLELERFSNHA